MFPFCFVALALAHPPFGVPGVAQGARGGVLVLRLLQMLLVAARALVMEPLVLPCAPVGCGWEAWVWCMCDKLRSGLGVTCT